MLDSSTLMQGGSAGDTGAGGSGGTAGDMAMAGSAGTSVLPMAGSTTGGGGMAAAGSSAGGMGGMSGGGVGGGGMGGGGMGGSGGKAGAGGMGGTGGAATGFRYARLVATSEQIADRVWSSCAELELFTTGDVAINHSGWTITADSQETVDENVPATNAIDANPATFWHTAWAPPPDDVNDAPLPHQLVIDLGSAKVITGFSYLPRQDGDHGHIKDYAFYLSNTNGNWGNAVKTGAFPAGTAIQKITF